MADGVGISSACCPLESSSESAQHASPWRARQDQLSMLPLGELVRGMQGQSPGWHQCCGCLDMRKCNGIRKPEEEEESKR
eukprot:182205-Chlamydomonas_euryale.AAC.2